MIPLVINQDVRAAIHECAEIANQEMFDQDTLHAMLKEHIAVGDLPGHSLMVPMGFRVIYSIENVPQLGGWLHHFSISLPGNPGRMVSPEAAWVLLKEFGITAAPSDWLTWIEDLEDDETLLNVAIHESGRFPEEVYEQFGIKDSDDGDEA